MRAAQKHARRRIGPREKRIEILVQKVVHARARGFAGLDQRHPQRAGLFDEAQARRQLGEFEGIRSRGHSARGSKHGHGALGERRLSDARNRARWQPGQGLGRRPYHAENAAIRTMRRQVPLLQGAQGLRRSCVAREHHQRTARIEEKFHRLAREAVHDFQTAAAIGCPRAVAEVEVIVLGQARHQRPQYRQAAKAGIEYTDHATSTSTMNRRRRLASPPRARWCPRGCPSTRRPIP